MADTGIRSTSLMENVFLNTLREATGPMHRMLETTPLSVALMDKEVSPARYAAYLAAMRPVIDFYESTIFPLASDMLDDIETRRKLPLIDRDLRVLGHTASSITPYKPQAAGIGKALAMGYMYVIEGSTLGGRVIMKHLAKTLNVDEEKGASFFAGYKEETSAKWRHFLDTLCCFAQQQDNADGVIAGAQQAFESIYNHFLSNSGK